MALITCPDCGNQVSTEAVACPQCGRPMAPAVIEPLPMAREVVVQEFAAEERKFPPWAMALIVLLGAGLIFALFMMLRGGPEDDTANRNVNVRVAAGDRDAADSRSNRSRTTSSASSDASAPRASEVTVPPSQDTTVVTPNLPPPTRTETATGETVPVGKSVLTIEAKIRPASGSATEQPVQRETFYLLKKDLESILSDADIDDEEGRGLVNAFGMSVLYPNRYPEINRKALAEINKHVVAKTLTDAQGKARFPDVKPDSYYLFGITKTRDGFSVWNTPITLSEGQTNLNLEPSGGGR
jgi:uncharacterized OB-fold protein